MNPRRWYIYALKDPRTDAIRYVGYSINVPRRVKGHVRDCNREQNYKARWIRSLVAKGLEPIVDILETGTGDWEAAERRWIKELRAAGCRLTNIVEGGGGATGLIPSAAHREKTRAALMGHSVSPETRAKMAAAKKDSRLTAEHKAKISKSLSALPLTEERLEQVRALAAFNKGAKRSQESRAKMAAAHKGVPLSPERIEKMRGRPGRKLTAEEIANLAAARKRRRLGGEVA